MNRDLSILSVKVPLRFLVGSFTDSQSSFTKDDYRFTVNSQKSILYVVCMGAVAGDKVVVQALGGGRVVQGTATGVKVLGWNGPLTWNIDVTGLHVQLPSSLPSTLPPVLSVSGYTDLQWDGVVRQGQDTSVQLDASMISKFNGGVSLDVSGHYLVASNWKSASESAEWVARVTRGGQFELRVMAASPGHARTATVMVQGVTVHVTIPETTGTSDFKLSTNYGLTLKASDSVVISIGVTDPIAREEALTGFQLAYVQIVPSQ